MSTGLDMYTTNLLHFNKNYKDELGNIVVPSNVGFPSISQANYKFKGGSLFNSVTTSGLQNGTTTAMRIYFPSDGLFDKGDFTFDWWEYRTSYCECDRSFNCQSDKYSYGQIFAYYTASTLMQYLSNNGTSWNLINGSKVGNPLVNQWVHRAFVRADSSLFSFENGSKIATFSVPAATSINMGNSFVLGSMSGYVDEVRVSKKARWTANFTPQTYPYVAYDKLSYEEQLGLLYSYK